MTGTQFPRCQPPPAAPKIRKSRTDETAPRRGLRLEAAAQYVGFGTTKFLELVKDGRMPAPKQVDGGVVWDIRRLDIAFDNLPDRQDANPWDNTCGFGSGTAADP